MAPAIPTQDYYAILEVSPCATPKEIKASYRRLALQHHPDKNGGSRDATTKIQLINVAWGVLEDTVKRGEYDRTRSRTGAFSSTGTRNTTTPQSSWQPPRPSTATQDDVRAQAESRRKRQEWLDWERIQEQHIRQCRNQVNSLKAAIALLDTSIELNRAKLKNDVPYWWNVFRSPMLSEKEKSEIRRGILDNGAAMRIKQASLKREQSDLEKLDIELVQRKNQELIRLEVERVEKEKRARAAREKAEAEARQRAAAEHARQRAAQEAKAKAAREEAAKEEAARRERMAEVEEALKRHRETMEKEREKRVEEARKARQTQRQNYSYGGRNGSQHQGHNQTPEISCEHSGWWSKLEGRRDCPHCTGPCYTFALQCPGCATIACVACRPKLQAGRKPPLYDHSQQRQGAANRHTKGNGRGHRAPQQGRNDEHNQYNIYDWF